MRNNILSLVLGIAILAGTSIADAQALRPTLFAQGPVTVPPSGALVTPPPAPVAVPSSGVLVTQPSPEARTVATPPVTRTQRLRTAETTAPTTARHIVHRRNGAGGMVTRTTVRESIVGPPAVATMAAAAPINIVPRYYNFVTPPASLRLRAQPLTARRAAPAVSTAMPVGTKTPMLTYQYVYEPDRILVIEPSSNIAVQAIPR